MDLNSVPTAATDVRGPGVTAPSARYAGPDVFRAVALIGVVVMNFHGYLLLASDGGPRIGDSWFDRLFDPWNGPLTTRFAAGFVLVAGVGVTLLTRSSIDDPARIAAARLRLIRRGVLLYTVGLLLDVVWPGTILVYYGAMFVLASVVFTWRTRWVVVAGASAAVLGAAIRLWRFERELDGHSVRWLTAPDIDSVRRYAFDVAVNGTHPLLPWFAFMCAGIVLGRFLGTRWWRRTAGAVGASLVAAGAVVSIAFSGNVADGPVGALDRVAVAVSINPYDRGVVYVASALGTALVAYAAIDWLTERFPTVTDPLRRAGQMTLTLYLLHVLVFEVLVEWLGWIRPAGLDVSLTFAAVYWIVAIALAAVWQRRFGRGPAEVVYRSFGG